ncbi:MAG TPA: UvrD-helicase domain-containing protein [Nitrospiraceae bacterium]|nr:UvrD-helicase domain-containing protein [Nitrospiraceae bacterium]
MASIPDQPSRDRAATATDRNVVVTAGAGTGKTTLLVDRLVYLLLHRNPPLPLSEIVALTFTNKAANEMKMRLRTELLRLREHEAARTALAELEQSQIGTIHSFAAHLLRLYPIEGAVDPSFQQDEGAQFEEQFAREWKMWLDGELGPGGPCHDMWREILVSLSLDELENLAKSLCGELVPMDAVALGSDAVLPAPIRVWFEQLADRADRLVDVHDKRTLIDTLLTRTAQLWRETAAHGLAKPESNQAFLDLDRGAPGQTNAWTNAEYRQAKHLLRIARACLRLDESPLRAALERLVPFATSFRRSFVAAGYVSFDGLLARCRTMLRDCHGVRRQLKARFRSMLVDEFQDTDPVQYELILYLAEAEGREADDWRDVRLEPGKLFIVGDPKQSIYAFRRADIEAYDRVVQERVLGQEPPGEAHKLQTNFRSHRRILGTLNAFFSGIFPAVAEVGLQPQHDPLVPRATEEPVLDDERVELRLVAAADAERDADSTTRAEAEELARWLAEDLIGKQQIVDHGAAVTIQPGHIAVLFRTLGALRDYVEAFRRYGIPCQAEGERHFYERQEILDTVNILRAAANPHDKLALVGVLRSPVGGLADADIAALAAAGLIDYRMVHPGVGCSALASRAFDAVRPLYELLSGLHHDLPRLPIPDVFPTLFARIPLVELAAASVDRDQAVGNLLKLQDLAAELVRRPAMTFQRMTHEFTRRSVEVPEEAEMSMTEDDQNEDRAGIMRLLSMHKAKGLEFPVVILAGLHRSGNRRSETAFVQHDWSTGIAGVRAGSFQTIGGLYTISKLAERRWAEQSRLLYVGMTRAKRKLVLSAGLCKHVQSDSFLGCIANRLELDVQEVGSTACEQTIACGEAGIHLTVRLERQEPGAPAAAHPERWQTVEGPDEALAARWAERRRRWADLSSRPMFLSPTRMPGDHEASFRTRLGHSETAATISRKTGTIAHRLLERWDFMLAPSAWHGFLDQLLDEELAGEPADQWQDMREALMPLFERFVSLPVYRDLQRATILGREVPFLLPWDDRQQAMSGTMDLLYRLDGQVWIADYKTDSVKREDVPSRVELYRTQADIYKAAVARLLDVPSVSFQFIFLRPGLAMTL